MAAFDHINRDFASDPISANRRLRTDISVLGTAVVAGSTKDSIRVLVPDCAIPPVGDDVRVDLRHVVELRLGPAFDMRVSPTGPLPRPHPKLSGTNSSEAATRVLGGGKLVDDEMAKYLRF